MASVSLLNGEKVQGLGIEGLYHFFYLVSLEKLKKFSEPQFFRLFYGDNNTCPAELDT